jgi:hypothetical protein
MRRLRRQLSYANVVSTACLFVVLGGSAYAAKEIVLPRNSVGTKQIRKHAVTKSKLKPKLVKSLRGARGLQGPAGSAGERGPQGVAGPAGPTFGDVATGAGGAGQPACTVLTPVSKTITLDHRGPLFVMAQGEYYANGSTSNGSATNVIVLRDRADTVTLATTQTQTARVSWPRYLCQHEPGHQQPWHLGGAARLVAARGRAAAAARGARGCGRGTGPRRRRRGSGDRTRA